jgi:hypothetical protein
MIVDVLNFVHFNSPLMRVTPLFVEDENWTEDSGGVSESLLGADLDVFVDELV